MRGKRGCVLTHCAWDAGGGGRCRQACPVSCRSHLDQRGELPRFPAEARDPARHQRLRVRAPFQRYSAPRCDVRLWSAASSAPPGSPPCPRRGAYGVANPALRGGEAREVVRRWFKARPVGQAALFHSANGSGPELLVSGRVWRACRTRCNMILPISSQRLRARDCLWSGGLGSLARCADAREIWLGDAPEVLRTQCIVILSTSILLRVVAMLYAFISTSLLRVLRPRVCFIR